MIKNRQLWITFLSQQNIKIKCIILEERPVQTTDNTSQREKTSEYSRKQWSTSARSTNAKRKKGAVRGS